jgi:hypothetical protein
MHEVVVVVDIHYKKVIFVHEREKMWGFCLDWKQFYSGDKNYSINYQKK